MKKTLKLMSIVAMALMLSVSTSSAWYLSIEPLVCTGLIPGDTFHADLFFNADASGNFVQNYEIALGFDHSELTWHDGSESWHTPPAAQHTPPSPLMMIFGPPNLRSGQVNNITAATFGPGGATLTGKTKIASIAFIATPDLTCDGALDVWFADSPMGDDSILVDGASVKYLGTEHILEGPDVHAVPIPGAVLLCGSALLGLIGIRNRKSA
ncbi:MAG: hypothetical protein JJV98_11000 [Desulfosarcina sp.]|nr:hypothetical protein [Desulfobacterales bacterium]